MAPAAALLALALWAPAGEEPSWVAEAISWGGSQDAVELPFARGEHSVRYSTPFLRVALAAHEAQRQGRHLDPANVPAELTASELHVFAAMAPVGRHAGRPRLAAAATVTLAVGKERLKPSRMESVAGELRAAFPLSPPIPPEARAMVEYSWVE